jgi:urease accessory protein
VDARDERGYDEISWVTQEMRRAIAVHRGGHWPAEAAIDSVTLAFVDRHRRRLRLVADSGNSFLLDLARTQHLADGDGLELDDGRYVRVCAAAERVLEIEGDGPTDLLRLAWHLGNRHLPVQALEGKLRIRDDHVIAGMVEGLGGRVTRLSAPFDPETGAYAGAETQHDRGHEH